jgi:hypothetical protein
MSAVKQDYTLSVNNEKIWKFFKENPTIDFETSILILLDIFDITIKNANATITNTINTQILQNINQQTNQMNELRTDINVMRNDLSKVSNEITSSLLLRFVDIKNQYVEEIKSIMNNTNNNTTEKIGSLIDKNNEFLINKTNSIITEVIPKSQETYYKDIQENIQKFQKNIIEETAKLISLKDNTESIDNFLKNFDRKTTALLQTVQQPIYSFITASEERINTNLINIRERAINKDAIFDNLNEFLNKNKYKNSNSTGSYGEEQLEQILTQLFPSALVQNTSKVSNSGDFIVQNREHNRPNILFETKHYTRNVDTEEVDKFIRDVKQRTCHGIFLSHTSGIVSKKQYQIELHSNNIVVYVLNCNYEKEKIKVAVDIIDTLSNCLASYITEDQETNTISSKILEDINEEYIKFSTQKLALIENIKDITKEMTKNLLFQVEEIKFPALTTFLNSKVGNYSDNAYVENNKIICPFCKVFQAKNQGSLASHRKACIKKYPPTIEPPTLQQTTITIQTANQPSLSLPVQQTNKISNLTLNSMLKK